VRHHLRWDVFAALNAGEFVVDASVEISAASRTGFEDKHAWFRFPVSAAEPRAA